MFVHLPLKLLDTLGHFFRTLRMIEGLGLCHLPQLPLITRSTAADLHDIDNFLLQAGRNYAVFGIEFLLLDTPTFNRCMMTIPEFTVPIVRVLGGMLKSCFSIIDGLALRDVTVRLARLLIDLAHENEGRPSEGSSQERLIRLPLSGEMLAQTLGTSRQTISTLLTDFTRLGILQKEQRGLYRILDEDRLRELLH